jgi:hypothetical protein
MPPPPSRPTGPRAAAAWSSWPQAVRLLVTGATFRPSFPVALVVGTLLCAVNQGADLAGGGLDVATLVRVAANYAIPYVVASIGYLSAHRTRPPAA